MVAIPIPLSSSPGRVPQEGAGRLLNAFAEPLGDTGPSKAVWSRVSGMSRFATSARTGFRGGLLVGGVLYAAWANRVTTFVSDGTETDVAALAGTAKGFWARNNKAGTPDIVFVDPQNGAFTVTASSVIPFADSDLPQPNSVCFQHGYLFFTIGDGRVFSTDLNAVTVNALNFTTAEAKPDGATRAVPFNDQLFIFGPSSIEVYQDTGNPTGFPYSHVTTIQRGLTSAYAVAGHEDGFGINLVWVADDNTVCRLNGYNAEKISPPDLDRLIEAVTDKTTLEACVYIAGGHPKWVLSCPAWTWEFDLNTQKWDERASYLAPRWRGTQAVYGFGKWITGDVGTGNLTYVDTSAHDEIGDPLIYRVESGPVEKFPKNTVVGRAEFYFSPGVGIATGADPIATRPRTAISWSDDGGTTWSNPLLRELGAQADGRMQIIVTRCGKTGPRHGRRWRLDVSDPVHVGLIGGEQFADATGHG